MFPEKLNLNRSKKEAEGELNIGATTETKVYSETETTVAGVEDKTTTKYYL